jgi:hypothetical protein
MSDKPKTAYGYYRDMFNVVPYWDAIEDLIGNVNYKRLQYALEAIDLTTAKFNNRIPEDKLAEINMRIEYLCKADNEMEKFVKESNVLLSRVTTDERWYERREEILATAYKMHQAAFAEKA